MQHVVQKYPREGDKYGRTPKVEQNASKGSKRYMTTLFVVQRPAPNSLSHCEKPSEVAQKLGKQELSHFENNGSVQQ